MQYQIKYGAIWHHTAPCGPIWARMGPSRPIRACPGRSGLVQAGPGRAGPSPAGPVRSRPGRFIFTEGVLNVWDSLPQRAVEAKLLDGFKRELDRALWAGGIKGYGEKAGTGY